MDMIISMTPQKIPFNNYSDNNYDSYESKQIDKIEQKLTTLFSELSAITTHIGIARNGIENIESNINEIKKTLYTTTEKFDIQLKEHDKRLDKLEQHKSKVEAATIILAFLITTIAAYRVFF
uniref:t-SNARE coiled-coil homology domain-containing protein n=1 Tax=viral metagenome TaxID=1070528 RepID=A0A6M3MCH1_9ZZZZ